MSGSRIPPAESGYYGWRDNSTPQKPEGQAHFWEEPQTITYGARDVRFEHIDALRQQNRTPGSAVLTDGSRAIPPNSIAHRQALGINSEQALAQNYEMEPESKDRRPNEKKQEWVRRLRDDFGLNPQQIKGVTNMPPSDIQRGLESKPYSHNKGSNTGNKYQNVIGRFG